MSCWIYVSEMSGQKGSVTAPKTSGRNKNKNTVKRNVNRNSTLTLATGDPLQAESEPCASVISSTSTLGMEAVEARTTAPTEPTKRMKRSVVGTYENEDVAPKKPKRDDTPAAKKHESRIFRNSRMKQHKKNRVFKDQADEDMDPAPGTSTSAASAAVPAPKKLKRKADKAKPKDGNQDDATATDDAKTANKKTNDTNNNHAKKPRKRKHQKKPAKMDAEEEPFLKMQRQMISSLEMDLTNVLQNMHIDNNGVNGNRYDLSDIINELVPSAPLACQPPNENIGCRNNSDNSNEFDLTKVVEWTKENWNKDCLEATTVQENNLQSVVIENLPVDMKTVYKDKLTNLFDKYGKITNIGPVDVQPSSGDEPTFNTTVWFDSEEAAINALDEDNTHFGDTRIRVRRPMPSMYPVRMGFCFYNTRMRTIYNGSCPVRAATLRPRQLDVAFAKNNGLGAAIRGLPVPAIAQRG